MSAQIQLMTMDEAAEVLRVSRRSLQEIIKRHPFYVPNGNRKLFTEADLMAILAGLRREVEQCRSSSSLPAMAKRRTGRSEEHTLESAWTRARELLMKRSQSKSSQRKDERSNVVSLPRQ